MTFDLLAAAVGAVTCGVVSLGVPWLIGRLPEPTPVTPTGDADPGADPGPDPEPDPEPRPDPEPKEAYADIAARPGLAVRSAVAGALLGGLLGGAVALPWALALLLPQVPIGIALSVIDWRTKLLPTRLVLPATALAVLTGAGGALLLGRPDVLVQGLIGLVVARSLFWVLWFLRSAGMGFGDVRLSALLGFLLACFGWPTYLVGFYSAFLVFGIPGLVLAIARRDRSILKRGYPFGPFLYAGAVIGILGGPLLTGLVG